MTEAALLALLGSLGDTLPMPSHLWGPQVVQGWCSRPGPALVPEDPELPA